MTEFTARLYHRLTAYDPDRPWFLPQDDPRLDAGFVPMDEDARPAPAKSYPARLPRVALPTTGASERSGEHGRGRPLDLVELGVLLHHSAGVVRRRTRSDGTTTHYRAASSAGNCHPLEIYVCSSGVDGLPDAVWHYDAWRGALVRIGPPAACESTQVVVCGVPWRTCWRYAERGYRHLWWDAGALLAQVDAIAAARGREAFVRVGFDDAAVAETVGADPRHEFPLVTVSLGGGATEPPEPGGPAVRGDLGPVPETLPLVADVHRAGGADRSAARAWSAPAPAAGDAAVGADVTELVRGRRSTRRFDPSAAVSREDLRAVLRSAGRVPAWDGGEWPLHTHVLGHGVAELDPGAYRVAGERLVRVRDADRDAGRRLCLDQDLGRDCGAVVLHTADLDLLLDRFGERGYRAAQLAAGFALGRTYLAATARGLGVTGTTFTDGLLPEVLGTGEAGLLAAAVGRRVV